MLSRCIDFLPPVLRRLPGCCCHWLSWQRPSVGRCAAVAGQPGRYAAGCRDADVGGLPGLAASEVARRGWLAGISVEVVRPCLVIAAAAAAAAAAPAVIQ